MQKNFSNNNQNSVIIFGGAGFIGTHLSQYLIENNFINKIICVDIKNPNYINSKIEYIHHDIRFSFNRIIKNIETIYNLAAVHTTPGHHDREYFETNILGAENVCDFAENNRIRKIIFTSSISPYGTSEEIKKENDIPMPNTAYGCSKLVAEYIHQCWLARSEERQLIILRPGVVFGKGEGGNFTRLYNSLKKKYFFYPGRKDTKKACIYVKDLVRALLEMGKSNVRFQIYNMCIPKSPSIEEIVKTISQITNVNNNALVMPEKLLILAAKLISFVLNNLLGKSNIDGIHPDRVKKLMISTNIDGEKLSKSSYALKYSLNKAIEDWYLDCNREGLY